MIVGAAEHVGRVLGLVVNVFADVAHAFVVGVEVVDAEMAVDVVNLNEHAKVAIDVEGVEEEQMQRDDGCNQRIDDMGHSSLEHKERQTQYHFLGHL